MFEKRASDELPPLIDWDAVAAHFEIPVRFLATAHLPDAFRHAKHVARPHAECEVCRLKQAAA